MAVGLPQMTTTSFAQRLSLTRSTSPPQSPLVSSNQLANEVIKKLLQLQLVSRLESLTKDESVFEDRSPPFSPINLQSSFNLDANTHQNSGRSLYKTEICKRYLMNSNSSCEYGIHCRFAHGLKELHLTARHPRYKTESCRAFQLTGTCRYGRRCDFIHNETPYELEILRTENALYQEYCIRHPNVKHVTLLEVLREFAPTRPELRGLLKHIETH
ncbi:unnamed protein product [Mesocestoides corti]|uniref:C3H1-type domain-containing protein n=1 Tax=Mesocestoides corti TaxID=53468 RepID=A0A0R3UG55_MESCO|nr:unnamed protein product [Mesocestoides corti]